MNWLKTSFCFLPLVILLIELNFSSILTSSKIFSPYSSPNYQLTEFEKILQISQLQPLGLKYYYSRQEIEFFLKNKLNQTTQVILSTNLSPLLQITALQKMLKTSNIKGEELKFIDFSSTRPYAALQNH